METVNFKREFIAGLTSFLTMSYIVVVNPAILSTEGTGMAFSGVMTATVLLCIVCTLMMGLYAKLPFAVAPGMGINAFFTYSLILGQKIPWPTALGMVFWSGILFLILSVLPIRRAIVKAMPVGIRHGAAVGIGLFLTFIGLKNGGIIRENPATFVTFSRMGLNTFFFAVGLILIAVLHRKKNPLAFLAGIGIVTLLAGIFGVIRVPENFVSFPDFGSVFFKLDFVGSLKLAFLPAILSIMFTDLFDSISTFVGLSQAAGLMDKTGEPKNVREGLIVDAFATSLAGLFGSSSGTAYIESAAGIEAGGRSGWTAVFTALLFVPCLFIGPVVQMVPAVATAPVLIVVGFLMFRTVKDIGFGKIEETLPAFLTMILIPLTFSITVGLIWGLISYVVLFILVGRAREISATLYGVAAVCVGLLFLLE
jgi:adenine/guanine/hypoxanthine permease